MVDDGHRADGTVHQDDDAREERGLDPDGVSKTAGLFAQGVPEVFGAPLERDLRVISREEPASHTQHVEASHGLVGALSPVGCLHSRVNNCLDAKT